MAFSEIDALLALGASVVFGALIVTGIVFSRRLTRSLNEVKLAAIRAYGLTDCAGKGIYPDLKGTVDGFEVRVDVIFLHGPSMCEAGHDRRPYTRVRVLLGSDPGISVRLRERFKAPPHPERLTGDAAFDGKFAVFADPAVDVAAILDSGARQAFLSVAQPLILEADTICWTQLKHVREPEVLLSGIESCLTVARHLKPPDAG